MSIADKYLNSVDQLKSLKQSLEVIHKKLFEISSEFNHIKAQSFVYTPEQQKLMNDFHEQFTKYMSQYKIISNKITTDIL